MLADDYTTISAPSGPTSSSAPIMPEALAETGIAVDVVALVVLGAILVILGTLLLEASRRHRRERMSRY